MSIKRSFFSNYIKIYFWQGLAIFFGFLTMFIVTPFLSSNKSVFGIYSVCISVSVFLSYADLGFLGAGQKFAAEEYARGNLKKEREIVGFTGFILFVFVIICALTFLYLSINPQIILSNISLKEKAIASKLLGILSIAAFITVLQRVAQMIYSIRIEEYIFQRLMIAGNFVKLLSVYYFFRKSNYDIVGYFAFVQLTNFTAITISLVIANRRYKYKVLNLIRSIKFKKDIFSKTKNLAFSSLFMTVSWLLYNELDNFVIGKVLGPDKVAIYALGLSMMTFFRSFFGGFFSPFLSRFNHYIGIDDSEGLKQTFTQLVQFTFPVVVFTVTTLLILTEPLVFTWVGPGYEMSVGIMRFLISCNIYSFITYPASILLVSQERIKALYIMGMAMPVIYWLGIALTFPILGLKAFSLFKFVAASITAVIYLYIIIKYLNISLKNFIEKNILSSVLPLAAMSSVLLAVRGFLPITKGKLEMLAVVATGASVAVFFIVITFLINKDLRIRILDVIRNRKAKSL